MLATFTICGQACDSRHEERIHQGWNITTGTPPGPTAVIRHDPSDGYDEVFTMSEKKKGSGLVAIEDRYSEILGHFTQLH